MFAERKVPRRNKNGNIRWVWECRSNVDNHAWDLEVMGLAAVILTRKVALIPEYYQ
jgi:hypothetical protein